MCRHTIVVEDWYVTAMIGGLMNDGSQLSRDTHRSLIGTWSVASQSGAPLVLVLGIVGQWVDSQPYASHPVSVEIHGIFGVCLCAAALTHFYNCMKQAPTAAPEDIARLSRGLSRQIYLLMYVLLGLRMAMELGRAQPPSPPQGFRDYLLAGVLAVLLIRVLAARRIHLASFKPLVSQKPSVGSL